MTTLNKSNLTKLTHLTTKSDKIRYLDHLGLTRGQIAKHLGIRYQHVRNVLITPVKKTITF